MDLRNKSSKMTMTHYHYLIFPIIIIINMYNITPSSINIDNF
jgi:hypothetical protein